MNQNSVVEIQRQGAFSLDQAQKIIPVIRAVTEKYVSIVESKMELLESSSKSQSEKVTDLEEEINKLIQSWHSKIRKLGGEPKGLWLVDLDSGKGYFCWKYPERELGYWHEYREGFKNRKPLDEEESSLKHRHENSTSPNQL